MTNRMSGVCPANGIELHYLRAGGGGPPLVLLHGLLGGGACWAPLARALEHDYDVLMPDARGHGQSSTPPHGYTYDDHAGDVIAFMDGLGLSAPVLLGHSMGGMTAALIASRVGRALRGLVLADPTFLSPQRQREVFESDVAEQHRRLLARDPREALAELRTRHSHRSAELVELVAGARLRTRMNAFEVLAPPNPDYRELMKAIAVPVLLIIGDAGVVSLGAAEELRRINPRIRIEVVEDAGHGLPYDQPERFAALVRSFLQTVAAPPQAV